MTTKVNSLEVLVLKSMIKKVVSDLSPYTTSPGSIIAFHPPLSGIPGIHTLLENLICHSELIRHLSKYYLHLVFKTTAKSNAISDEYSKICKNLIGDTFQLRARTKFDSKGSEVLITFENGMVKSQEIHNFLLEAMEFFGIEHMPIAAKCTFIFSRPKSSMQNEHAVSKLYFKPLRNYEGVNEKEMVIYIMRSLAHISKTLSNQYSNVERGDHLLTSTDYNEHILNFQTCPCQSYICSGGLDAEFSSKLRVCTVSYCDTHPFFNNKA